MRARRAGLAVIAMLAVFGVVTGLVTGIFGSLAHRGLYAAGLWSTNGASTLPPGGLDAPVPRPSGGSTIPAAVPSLPPPVLSALTEGPVPSSERVQHRIAAVRVKGAPGSYTGAVLDVGTGRRLFSHQATQPRIPASTLKLLTSTAALSILGPDRRFPTTVVRGGGHQVVLVGGGDPYLSRTPNSQAPGRASLAELAGQAAAQVKQAHTTTVTLGYDATLFTGPAWNRNWPPAYRDMVTPPSALAVDEGRVSGQVGPRVRDPAKDAAQAFAAELKKRGVRVTAVRAVRALASAAVVARVWSMPLEQIVQQLLMTSDNDAAEIVLRQAAIGGGQPGSFVGGVAAVHARLTKLGVWGPGTAMVDGSGLSRSTRVSADGMVKLLRLAATPAHPELRPVIDGLPVAGVEGSLGHNGRFAEDGTGPGRGVVRGKTGTLTKVHALAGIISSRDGSLVVYAFLINDPKNDYAATVWLDRVTTAISTCGCR